MKETTRFRFFPGPSRFGAEPCVVAWPDDAARPVPAGALAVVAKGFKGAVRSRPNAPLLQVATEVAGALVSILVPTARLVAKKETAREGALGIHTWDEDVRLILDASIGVVRKAIKGEPAEIPVDELARFTPDHDELPEQTVLRNAAQMLGIFAQGLDLSNGSALLVLGSGSRQRRLLGLLPDATTFAGMLSTNKNVACELLAAAGLKVPSGGTVHGKGAARKLAAQLGFPVTLKVATGSRQRGVVPCIVSEKALERALELFPASAELRLERHVPGTYYRAFVANGKLVACASNRSPTVTGDGKKKIADLVARTHPWFQKVLDEKDATLADNARSILVHVLAGYDLEPTSVLAKGQTVPVAFPTSEGFAHDVTPEVHPENARALVRATRVLGMFWSGIDVQAPRIDVPFSQQEAAILEVNDIPAWAFHACPLTGKGVDMAPRIFEAFFGERSPNVPVAIAFDGRAGKLARALVAKGVRAVLAADALKAALDPEADAIVLAPDPARLLEDGLAVPGIDVVLGDVPPTVAGIVEHARKRAKGVRVKDEKRALAVLLERA